jgi:TolB protein
MSRPSFFALLSLAASACDLGSLGGTGGGGGGTAAAGGGSTYNGFASGFVFVNRADGNVYVTDATNVPTPVAVTSIGGARTPSLSHDGKVIVFAESTASDSGLVTVPSQGGQATTILLASANPGVSNVRTPVFTPDGLHIVFSYDYGGSSAVGQVGIDGSNPSLLAGASSFAVSGGSLYPDGSAFLAAAGPSTDQLTQLVGVVIATDTQTTIASTLGLDAENLLTRVVVSPDGTMAAFDARVSSGSSRIFVMNLSTLVVAQVTDEPGAPGANDTSPCWVGSTQIAYSSTASGADALYVIAASSVRTAGTLQLTAAIDPWFGPN